MYLGDVTQLIHTGKGERIIQTYYIAFKPLFPRTDEHLVLTNKRLILITQFNGLTINGKIIDEVQIEKIRGVHLGMMVRGLILKRKLVYIKLKTEHLEDIQFGVLAKRRFKLFSRRLGPDADKASRELGQLIRTVQENPEYEHQRDFHPPPPSGHRSNLPPPPNYQY